MILGGKNYTSFPPAFSNDAKQLLIPSGKSISIFSTSTALLTASLDSHTAQVTSVVVVPTLPSFCYTSSLDGTVKFWDFSTQDLIKTITLNSPVHSLVVPAFETKADLFAYVLTERRSNMSPVMMPPVYQIQKCNLTKSRLVGNLVLGETGGLGPICLSPNGKYIGICEKRKVRIWEVPSREAEHGGYRKIRLHHTKGLSTVAFHPSEDIVAAGDVTGRILIWRGVGGKGVVGDGDGEEKPGVRGNDDAESCTTWHWHPSQVNVLFFSPDGAYLYSGIQLFTNHRRRRVPN